jgi:hypothetical protein
MIDLKRLNSGNKLIKEILEKSKENNQPWTKDNQTKQINTQKNTRRRYSAPSK